MEHLTNLYLELGEVLNMKGNPASGETDLLVKALGEYGVEEIKGSTKHNPRVIRYFAESGFPSIIDDETAWCSAFANWCAIQCGLEASKKLNARSWLDVGKAVKTGRPGRDVAVFWREDPKSWKGHVGLFIAQNETHVFVLGGNQSNKVQITAYPTGRLLGIRRLEKVA